MEGLTILLLYVIGFNASLLGAYALVRAVFALMGWRWIDY